MHRRGLGCFWKRAPADALKNAEAQGRRPERRRPARGDIVLHGVVAAAELARDALDAPVARLQPQHLLHAVRSLHCSTPAARPGLHS
jgi:hypothetical protein